MNEGDTHSMQQKMYLHHFKSFTVSTMTCLAITEYLCHKRQVETLTLTLTHTLTPNPNP
jgi:hypothetical protein